MASINDLVVNLKVEVDDSELLRAIKSLERAQKSSLRHQLGLSEKAPTALALAGSAALAAGSTKKFSRRWLLGLWRKAVD